MKLQKREKKENMLAKTGEENSKNGDRKSVSEKKREKREIERMAMKTGEKQRRLSFFYAL